MLRTSDNARKALSVFVVRSTSYDYDMIIYGPRFIYNPSVYIIIKKKS